MNGISSDQLLKTLSDDAKVILGGYFGPLGIPGRSTLTFQMKEVRPTERALSALSELVEAGAMKRADLPNGGIEYTVLLNCTDFGKWIDRNRSKGWRTVTEPVPGSARAQESSNVK